VTDPKDPPLDSDAQKPDPDEPEGWEALTEEPGGGTMGPSEELEAALREASDAVGARGNPREGDQPGAPQGSGGAGEAVMEALATELQSLKGEYEAQSDKLIRLQAEFENFRRRNLKERQEAHRYGQENLVKDLLSTVDNLDRAIEYAEQSDGGDLQGLLQGVELVRRELLAALAKHSVVVIDSENQPFDPALHEAMAQTPDGSVPPNTVVQVFQKGYMLLDRMLRPARVVVSKSPEEGGSGQG
jgi:molecular chaperone GrpE